MVSSNHNDQKSSDDEYIKEEEEDRFDGDIDDFYEEENDFYDDDEDDIDNDDEYEVSEVSTNSNTINPKPCNYGCGTRIYWNTSENAYLEVFTKKKHICPNRTNKKFVPLTTTNAATAKNPTY